MPSTPRHAPLIGIFDSGVGGLSILRALRQQRPASALLYVADSAHAPYGERDVEHVVDRSLRLTQHLVNNGARMVVVACNTATALAIDLLRERHPNLLLVGVEPGVKPAVAVSRNRRIGVLATPATLASPRFAALVDRHAVGCAVLSVPCPGLAAAIERGEDGREEVGSLLDDFCHRLVQAEVDTVVLGCTHYPFAAEQIAARLPPGVVVVDTAEAVARQAIRLHSPSEDHGPQSPGIRLQSTGDLKSLEGLAHSGLGLCQSAEAIVL